MLQAKKKLELELRQIPNTGEAKSIVNCALKMLQNLCKFIIRNNEVKQFSGSYT